MTSGNRFLAAHDGDRGGQQRDTRRLTPKWIVEGLGHFDLDPCGAPGHDLADRTYLLENGDDGLRDPWSGRVFLNPPYGKQLEPFLERLADHGDGIALLFARTETRWFHRLIWKRADALMFPSRRVTFLRPDGTPYSANGGAPSVLVAYGQRNVEALEWACAIDVPGFVVYPGLKP